MKKFSLLFPVLLLAGCSTVTKYNAKIASGPAHPANYPIYAYGEGARVPRTFEVIGTMHVGDTPFTVFGGSLDDVMKTLRLKAAEKGADAIQLTSLKTPEFQTPHYRADANFLRFTDKWESILMSEEELLAYFQTNAATLDPIEGIWVGNDLARSRVGIMRNNAKPRRDFIAFILDTSNPAWQKGDKKLGLAVGERPGVYRGVYYQDDYQGFSLAFVLPEPAATRFVLKISDESRPITFVRQ